MLACLNPGQYEEQKESVAAVTQVGGDRNRNPNATGHLPRAPPRNVQTHEMKGSQELEVAVTAPLRIIRQVTLGGQAQGPRGTNGRKETDCQPKLPRAEQAIEIRGGSALLTKDYVLWLAKASRENARRGVELGEVGPR